VIGSLIARDGFLPRPLSNIGDRLVFSNGIVLLGALAAVLIIAFGGDTHALLPLYANFAPDRDLFLKLDH